MGPIKAVKSAYSNYASFHGRATRPEYWWWAAYHFASGLPFVFDLEWLAGILMLANIVPGIAVTVRRFHDSGKSGANFLWASIPWIGGIILIVFMVQPTEPQDNQYGPVPVAATA